MKIPNYDVKDDFSSNYKQKVSFMPDRCFRMLICAPSGGGKTNHPQDPVGLYRV